MINRQKIKTLSLQEKQLKIEQYYHDKPLVIMGLNDSQGVNLTKTFYKKAIIQNVAYKIKKDALVLDLSSLTMNKTEHINYFLDANLSLEQVKLSQQYSAIEALKKVMSDFHLPKVLGNAAKIYQMNYKIEAGDDQIFITDTLANAENSIIIYSSGVNNLMRSVGSNPFSIRYDYKTRSIRPNYNYATKKAMNPSILHEVLLQIEHNLCKLKSLNPNSIIMILNAPCPTTFEREEFSIFKKLIAQYNQGLKQISEKLHIRIIHIEDMSPKVFHFDQLGNNQVIDSIIETLYQEIINYKETENLFLNRKQEFSKNIDIIINALLEDYQNVIQGATNKSGYDKKREFQIAKEHETEMKVMKKVKTKTIY